MKTWGSVLVIFLLALGIASCADTAPREQKFARMRQLAEQGSPGAQYNLGLMYEQGYGVTPRHKAGGGLVRESCGQGEADAQYRLGSLYYSGQGVPRICSRPPNGIRRPLRADALRSRRRWARCIY